MKPKSEIELLKEWRIDSEVPSNFNASVWRRIEERTQPSLATVVVGWLSRLAASKTAAASFAGVAIMVGVACGYTHSGIERHQERGQLEARYLQAVDPYAPRMSP